MPLLRATVLILLATLLAGASVGLFVPSLRPWLVQEDHVVETTCAVAFALGCSVALRQAWLWPDRRLLQLGIAGVALLAFLDELSFGERLLALRMPQVLGVKIDAAHDLVELALMAARQLLEEQRAIGVLALVGVLASLSAVLWFRRLWLTAWVRRARHEEPVALGALFVACAVLAIVIDLDFIHSYVLFALEEMLELNAAIILNACSLSLGRLSAAQARGPARP